MANRQETMQTVTDLIFLGSKITADGDCSHEIKKHLLLGRKAMTNLNSILKIRDITLSVSLGPFSQSYGFSSCHVCMWELYHKESWVPKNLYFWTVLLETLESPLDCKEIKPIIPKGNQPWIFIGRTDTEAEAPILWPPDEKSRMLGQNSDDGKDWRQKEKRVTGDEIVGWHHQPNGHEFEQTLGDSEGQGSLPCCSPWGCKESDMT